MLPGLWPITGSPAQALSSNIPGLHTAYRSRDNLQVLRHFLDLFVKRAAPQEQLTAAIKYIIIPLVQRAHENKEADAVTDADLDTIVQKLLGPPQHISGA